MLYLNIVKYLDSYFHVYYEERQQVCYLVLAEGVHQRLQNKA